MKCKSSFQSVKGGCDFGDAGNSVKFWSLYFSGIGVKGEYFLTDYRQILFGAQVAILATLIFYLAVPAVFHFSPFVQRHLVFLPYRELTINAFDERY